MQASAVEQVIAGLKAAGVSVVCYLPDSLLKELYPALDRDPDIRTIRVTNEGEGAAICGGIWLSGKKSALIMENSGLRASIEPLARMGMGAGIPVVMIMSYRGDLGENNWWAIPHGMTMEPLLEAMRIPYRIVDREDAIQRAIADAYAWSHTAYYHSAVNYTSLGYGDLIMSPSWKLLGPLETADGMLLFGVSTAMIFAVIQRLVETHYVDLKD